MSAVEWDARQRQSLETEHRNKTVDEQSIVIQVTHKRSVHRARRGEALCSSLTTSKAQGGKLYPSSGPSFSPLSLPSGVLSRASLVVWNDLQNSEVK